METTTIIALGSLLGVVAILGVICLILRRVPVLMLILGTGCLGAAIWLLPLGSVRLGPATESFCVGAYSPAYGNEIRSLSSIKVRIRTLGAGEVSERTVTARIEFFTRFKEIAQSKEGEPTVVYQAKLPLGRLEGEHELFFPDVPSRTSYSASSSRRYWMALTVSDESGEVLARSLPSQDDAIRVVAAESIAANSYLFPWDDSGNIISDRNEWMHVALLPPKYNVVFLGKGRGTQEEAERLARENKVKAGIGISSGDFRLEKPGPDELSQQEVPVAPRMIGCPLGYVCRETDKKGSSERFSATILATDVVLEAASDKETESLRNHSFFKKRPRDGIIDRHAPAQLVLAVGDSPETWRPIPQTGVLDFDGMSFRTGVSDDRGALKVHITGKKPVEICLVGEGMDVAKCKPATVEPPPPPPPLPTFECKLIASSERHERTIKMLYPDCTARLAIVQPKETPWPKSVEVVSPEGIVTLAGEYEDVAIEDGESQMRSWPVDVKVRREEEWLNEFTIKVRAVYEDSNGGERECIQEIPEPVLIVLREPGFDDLFKELQDFRADFKRVNELDLTSPPVLTFQDEHAREWLLRMGVKEINVTVLTPDDTAVFKNRYEVDLTKGFSEELDAGARQVSRAEKPLDRVRVNVVLVGSEETSREVRSGLVNVERPGQMVVSLRRDDRHAPEKIAFLALYDAGEPVKGTVAAGGDLVKVPPGAIKLEIVGLEALSCFAKDYALYARRNSAADWTPWKAAVARKSVYKLETPLDLPVAGNVDLTGLFRWVPPDTKKITVRFAPDEALGGIVLAARNDDLQRHPDGVGQLHLQKEGDHELELFRHDSPWLVGVYMKSAAQKKGLQVRSEPSGSWLAASLKVPGELKVEIMGWEPLTLTQERGKENLYALRKAVRLVHSGDLLEARSHIRVHLSWTGRDETVEVVDRYGKTREKRLAYYYNTLGMRFVWVGAGRFLMGSTEKEEEFFKGAHECPQHPVILSEPFCMLAHEVTQAQYQEVMAENPSGYKDPDKPVHNVSYDDAVRFCNKLNAMEKLVEYHIPTEAQWEYACRAGTTSPFYTGKALSASRVRFKRSRGDGGVGPWRVGGFAANGFGLFDMYGNVWEWTANARERYMSGSITDPSPTRGGRNRVVRGGGWTCIPDYCRSAVRSEVPKNTRDDEIGFRVICICTKERLKILRGEK